MNSIQLQTFCAVARKRSFTQAAQEVNLSQSTVSFHIRSLEQEFGAKLFDRATREVTLTQAGELLLDYSQRILDLEKTAHQTIDELQGLVRGDLKIGASTIPGEYMAPPRLGAFREKYPDIALTLGVADTAKVVTGVLTGDFELGLVGAAMNQPALTFEPFAEDQVVLITAPGHVELNRPYALQDILSWPYLLREPGSGTRAALEQALGERGLTLSDLNVVMELGSTTAIKAGVRAGLGVSFVSAWAVQDERQWGLLERISLPDFPIRRRFFLIHRTHRTLSPAAAAFARFLRENPPTPPEV